MPTYGYRCTAGDHQFEIVQRFSDDPIRECPTCGAEVRRIIHPVGVVFKGSGWYITDSRKSSEGGTASAKEGEAKPAEPKKDAAKAEPAAAKAVAD
jgi:putative FmdB family regulatory protein